MKGKKAIVREPGDNYQSCISSHPLKKSLDITRARKQHQIYCQTLEELGMELIKLPRDNIHTTNQNNQRKEVQVRQNT